MQGSDHSGLRYFSHFSLAKPVPADQSFRFSKNAMTEQIVILDFGSQYTQVIARRIRECNVYSVIVRYDMPAEELAAMAPKGLILSGGPASVYAKGAPLPNRGIFKLNTPVLGICYG